MATNVVIGFNRDASPEEGRKKRRRGNIDEIVSIVDEKERPRLLPIIIIFARIENIARERRTTGTITGN